MVSLWDMLTFLSGASAFGGALAAAQIGGEGGFRLVVGISLGVGLGILSVLLARVPGRFVMQSVRREGELRVVYLSTVLWIFASWFLSMKITQIVIQLTFP